MKKASGIAWSGADPWFRLHPRAALAVIAALFAGILALRLSAGSAADAYSMLYVLPVSLAAVVFGVRGGAASGVLAVGLIGVWVVAQDVDLPLTAWFSRATPILLLGLLLGHASDRLRRAEVERRRLARAALLHRKAIEINDSLIQGMTAAKWSLESGRAESGLQTLDDTIGRAQTLVSGLIRDAAIEGRSEELEATPRPT